MNQVTLKSSPSEVDWQQWDAFLASSKRGIYLQLSNWLKSYRAYGFREHLILVQDLNQQVIGGVGFVMATAGPLKILVAPYGPILKDGEESELESILNTFQSFAKSSGAFLSQIAIPLADDKEFGQHFLPSQHGKSLTGYKGLVFKYVTGISGIRAIQLYPECADAYSKVKANYKSATRRDVNKSGRMGHSLVWATSESQLRQAYSLIESNAQNQGYSVRAWSDFGPTLIALVNQGFALVPCCEHEGELKGALVIFDLGKKMHYIMGGTIREKKDLMVGHFLQDQVIQLAIQKKYDFYDISMGGSEGVVRFKEGFGGQIIQLPDPYYWVYSKLQFIAFKKLMPLAQKNKKLISKVLKKLQ